MNGFTAISAIAGFGLVVCGCSLIYHPLGFLAAGGLLLALAFTTAHRKKS